MQSGRKIWERSVTKLLSISVLVGSIMVWYIGGSLWKQQRDSRATTASQVDLAGGGASVNPFGSANGTHLIAFVITASDCGWSSQRAAMDAVGAIRTKLRSAHGDSYAQIRVVGVALDRDLDAGLRFLSELGKRRSDRAFDQVIVGGSWLNEQIVRFVWRDGIAQPASPQVIVIERRVNTESYLLTSTIAVGSDLLVANPIGTQEIIAWIDEGFPLDRRVTG